MTDEVADVRQNQAPEALRRMKERHASSRIKDEDWTTFLLEYAGDVDTFLTEGLKRTRASVLHWKGMPPAPSNDLQVPLVDATADLERTSLAILEAEIGRLQKLVGGDREMTAKFAAVSKRITEETAALERIKEKLANCEQAKQRIAELSVARQTGYVRVFEAVLAEQEVLADLYAPLMARVSGAPGALGKLSFTVRRVADVERWANGGEELLDLRRQGPLRGRGTLRNAPTGCCVTPGKMAMHGPSRPPWRRSARKSWSRSSRRSRGATRRTIVPGRSASPDGSTAPVISPSTTASITTAWTSGSCRRARAASVAASLSCAR